MFEDILKRSLEDYQCVLDKKIMRVALLSLYLTDYGIQLDGEEFPVEKYASVAELLADERKALGSKYLHQFGIYVRQRRPRTPPCSDSSTNTKILTRGNRC